MRGLHAESTGCFLWFFFIVTSALIKKYTGIRIFVDFSTALIILEAVFFH